MTKHTLEITLANGVKLTVSNTVATLRDASKLAKGIQNKVRDALRVMPELAAEKVTKLRVLSD